jgi:spermidine synthase
VPVLSGDVKNLLVALLISFCSFAYEFLIANALVSLLGLSVLANSITIGCFLLGIGIGTILFDKLSIPPALATVEFALTALGALIASFLFVAWIMVSSAPGGVSGLTRYVFLGLAQVLSLGLGVLTSFELPLLLRGREEKFSILLSFTYFGSLAAAVSLPLIIYPWFGLWGSFSLVASVNFFLGLALMNRSRKSICGAAAAATCLLVGIYVAPRAENYHLLSQYQQIFAPLNSWWDGHQILGALGRVERSRSAYQTIDLLESKQGYQKLYLDQKLQLDSRSANSYHMMMGKLPFHLDARSASARKLLVLGGGDGVLLKQLLEQSPNAQITLVELDPAVLRLARENQFVRGLGAGAIASPQVRVVVGDAYQFVRRSVDSFDAIFIDLPFPADFDTSRLFSYEFYSFVNRRLEPGGFVVLDLPLIPSDLKPEASATNSQMIETLLRAGARTVVPYGGHGDGFALYFLEDKAIDLPALEGRWRSLVPEVARPTFRILPLPPRAPSMIVNSVFRPTLGLRAAWWEANQ